MVWKLGMAVAVQQRWEREASPSACCSKDEEDSVVGKLGRLRAPRTSESLLRLASRWRWAALGGDLREETAGVRWRPAQRRGDLTVLRQRLGQRRRSALGPT
jgi:hypothetical protein